MAAAARVRIFRALTWSAYGQLPFASSLEARALRLLVHTKIWGLIVAFSWTGLSGFDQPKSSWSRAAMWLLVGALALAAARYGTRIVPRSPVHIAAAFLIGATALAAVFAEHGYTALFGERGRYLGLSFTVDMAVLYTSVAIAFREGRQVAALGASVAAAALVAIGYGLVQRIGLDPSPWGTIASLRPFSTFGNPDMFGHFLGALASGAAAVAALVAHPRVRIAAAALALLATALIAIVATRGAVLGLAAGLAAVAACVLAVRGRGALRPLVLGAPVAALLAAGIALATPLGARLAAIVGSPELADRIVIWEGAWRAFLLRPFLGFGPDNLGVAFHLVRQPGTEAAHAGAVAIDQGHDWILHALATTGILGTAALIATIATSAVVLWRCRTRAPVSSAALLAVLAAYWTHALVSVEAVSVSWIPWVVAGLAAGGGPAAAVVVPLRAFPAFAVAGIAALALIIAASSANAARANDAAGLAAVSWARRDAAATTAAANDAIAFDAGRGEHWNYRGLARGLRGLYALAAMDHEEAWRRVPHQTNYLANLARMRAAQAAAGDASGGGAAAAYAAARRAVSIEPNLASTHRALAEVALTLGDADLALTESIAAMRLAPKDGSADATAAQAALRHPERGRARALLREAISVRASSALAAALASLE